MEEFVFSNEFDSEMGLHDAAATSSSSLVLNSDHDIFGPSPAVAQGNGVVKRKKIESNTLDNDGDFMLQSPPKMTKRIVIDTPSTFSSSNNSSTSKLKKKSKLSRVKKSTPSYANELDDIFAQSEHLNKPITQPSSSIIDMFDTSITDERNINIDMVPSYPTITPEQQQYNRIENKSDHMIPPAVAAAAAAAEMSILESGGIDSTSISESRALDLSGNENVPSTPSQGKLINECRILHKSGNMQTVQKMESSRLFSEKVSRIETNTKDIRRVENNEKHKGSFYDYHSRVHYISSRAPHGKHPNTVVSIKNTVDGKSIPSLVFLNGHNSMSTHGMFVTPPQFIELVGLIINFLDNPSEYFTYNLSHNTCVMLKRFSIKVISVDEANREKICHIDFESLRQMTAYLNALKDLVSLIQHKTNVPLAYEIFQAKVVELFAKCSCSDKSKILSNLAYLYYNYVDVQPLPHHLTVNKHLFDSVEKFVL